MRILVFIFIICTNCLVIKAQINANWYYGYNKGFKFQGNAIQLDPGAMQATAENAVSISDRFGDLLFYSNGERVWDSNNDLMPNGDSLYGASSAAQGLLTFRIPTHPTRYYLFAASSFEQYLTSEMDLTYSIIDMSLNAGNGDIDTAFKNIVLQDTLKREQLHGTYARGGFTGSVWILTHLDTNRLLIYRADENNVILHDNLIFGDGSSNGGFVLSSNGNYLMYSAFRASQNGLIRGFTIASFNPATGTVTNPLFIETSGNVSSMEFRRDEKKAFVSTYAIDSGIYNTTLMAFSISSMDSLSIINSADTIFSSNDSIARYFTDMEYAPNGKLYLKRFNDNDTLSSISFDENGAYTFTYIDLNTGFQALQQHHRLPTFLPEPFHYIIPENLCYGSSTSFNIHQYADSAYWNFGDANSGILNQDSGLNVTHLFTDTGLYQVTCIVFDLGLVDTLKFQIQIDTAPTFSIPDSITSCQFDTIHFKQNAFLYALVNHDTFYSPDYVVDSASSVTLVYGNACDTIIDSTFVSIIPEPSVIPIHDSSACVETTLFYNQLTTTDWKYFWSTGDTTASISIHLNSLDSSTQRVWIEASNACGISSDTGYITPFFPPNIQLPEDTIHCLNSVITIAAFMDNVQTFHWQNGDSLSLNYKSFDSEIVWLKGENECGQSTDTMVLQFMPEIKVTLGNDTQICKGDSIIIDAFWPNSTYLWSADVDSDQQNKSQVTATEEGNYIVTISQFPCTTVKQKRIEFLELCDTLPCKLTIPNVFSPNGDGMNDVLKIESTCSTMAYRIFLYNRWGQLVFQEHLQPHLNAAWDGYIHGEPASEGTYYLSIVDDDGNVNNTHVYISR